MKATRVVERRSDSGRRSDRDDGLNPYNTGRTYEFISEENQVLFFVFLVVASARYACRFNEIDRDAFVYSCK